VRNILLTLAFDGNGYHGWQIQNNAVTVQQRFQEAFVKLMGECPDIKACSRTDTGVSAENFCVSLKLELELPDEKIPIALNRYLPRDIAVLNCATVPEDFHARYSCKGKRYTYTIWNNPIRYPFLEQRAYHYWYKLDEKMLNKAASYYFGKHDFSSFCSVAGNQNKDKERTIFKSEVTRNGDIVVFTVEGDGFLYNMVRIMTGTLLRIAQGKLAVDSIPEIIGKKDRSFAGPTAPAVGLCLTKVYY
jgi:tRNA pseudouridine38-40 synthase